MEKTSLDCNEMRELMDEFEKDCESLEVYRMDESKLRKGPYKMDDKVKIISLLREDSQKA